MPGRASRPDCPTCGKLLPGRGQPCASCAAHRAQAPPETEGCLVIPEVEARVGAVAAFGPLVLRREGLYLFIRRWEWRRNLVREAGGAALNVALGTLASLLGRVFQEDESEPRPPAGSRPREEFQPVYDRLLHEFPELLRCHWCLPLARGELMKADFRGGSLLELATAEGRLDLVGDFMGHGAPDYLLARGYPARRLGPAVGKRLAFAAAVALACWGTYQELAELREASDWAAPRVEAASEALKPGAFEHVRVRDGRRFYVFQGGREIPAEELSWQTKAWYQFREVGVILLMGALIAVVGVWTVSKGLR